MTCIAGVLVGDGRVVIGADSAGVRGLDMAIRKDKKVFRNGDMLIGYTTSFRMGQLLQYSLTVPYHRPDVDVDRYMRVDFVDAVRDTLKRGGFASKDSEVERGGEFLIGYRGRLFTMMGDYQVAESALPFAACGCGEDFALGAMWGMNPAMRAATPEDFVRRALEASETFSAGVRRPFHVLTLEAPAEKAA